VIENMAPVLTRLFTPLFAAMLIMFLGPAVDRTRHRHRADVLIAFDLLLVWSSAFCSIPISARDPGRPRAFDVVQVVLVISALLADAVALWAIAARITEFGFSPNRVAALGENVILWSIWRGPPCSTSLPERARIVHLPRKMADGLPAGLRRVGGDGRDPLSAAVPIHLKCNPHPH
jgi:hypothetical protein